MKRAIIYDAVDKLHVVGHVAWLNSIKTEPNSRPQIPVAPQTIGGVAALLTQVSIRILSVLASLARSELCLLAAWAPYAEKPVNSDSTHLLLESAFLREARCLGLVSVSVGFLEEYLFARCCLRVQGDNSC